MFKKLIDWSLSDHNELPWRKERSLYRTLVSEIMLQQTTVSTVLNHFERFLKEYPSVIELAKTTEDEICISWKGLGYYRRARNLRKAAIDIVENHGGEIPLDYNKLISISGIGEYTANALLSIGADLPALAIDANLERVLSRIYGIKEKKGPKLQKLLKSKFENKEIVKEISKFSSRELNEAFMDLGRVYCQANKVECPLCPMKTKCLSLKSGEPLSYPISEKKVREYIDLDLLRVVVLNSKKDKVLGYIKEENQWLSGQVEVPTFVLKCKEKSFKQYPKISKEIDTTKLKKIKTSITKYRITNYILELSEKEFQKFEKDETKFSFYNKSKSNFSTATIKVLNR